MRSIDVLEAPVRTLTRCRVCGFAEVRTDEVVHRGTLWIAECPRCDHRWTRSPESPPAPWAVPVRRVPAARRAGEEPAAAA